MQGLILRGILKFETQKLILWIFDCALPFPSLVCLQATGDSEAVQTFFCVGSWCFSVCGGQLEISIKNKIIPPAEETSCERRTNVLVLTFSNLFVKNIFYWFLTLKEICVVTGARNAKVILRTMNHCILTMTGHSLEAFMVPDGEQLLPGEQDLTQVKVPPVKDMMLIKTVSIGLAWYVCIFNCGPLNFLLLVWAAVDSYIARILFKTNKNNKDLKTSCDHLQNNGKIGGYAMWHSKAPTASHKSKELNSQKLCKGKYLKIQGIISSWN